MKRLSSLFVAFFSFTASASVSPSEAIETLYSTLPPGNYTAPGCRVSVEASMKDHRSVYRVTRWSGKNRRVFEINSQSRITNQPTFKWPVVIQVGSGKSLQKLKIGEASEGRFTIEVGAGAHCAPFKRDVGTEESGEWMNADGPGAKVAPGDDNGEWMDPDGPGARAH